jgi:hypothetical protein
MTDEIKEKIKLETELLRFFFLSDVALGEGTFGVILGLPSGIRLILASIGILATIGVAYVSWWQYLKINRLVGGTL